MCHHSQCAWWRKPARNWIIISPAYGICLTLLYNVCLRAPHRNLNNDGSCGDSSPFRETRSTRFFDHYIAGIPYRSVAMLRPYVSYRTCNHHEITVFTYIDPILYARNCVMSILYVVANDYVFIFILRHYFLLVSILNFVWPGVSSYLFATVVNSTRTLLRMTTIHIWICLY